MLKHLALAVGLLFVCLPARGEIIHVPGEVLTIQAGIDAAAPGDTVLVAPGTHSGPGNRDLDFGAKNLVLTSEAGRDSTVIDCGSTEGDEHRAFTFAGGQDSTCVVRGFQVIHAWADSAAGFLCINSSPTITQVDFSVHMSEEGALYCVNSSPNLTDVYVERDPSGSGGEYPMGMRCISSSPRLVRVTFDHLISGAMECRDGSDAILRDCLFLNNINPIGTGVAGLYCSDSSPTLDGVSFIGNYGNGTGGLHCDASSPTLVDVVFINNDGYGGAGGMSCHNGSNPVLTSVEFNTNYSDNVAGVICAGSSNATFTDVVFRNHYSAYGTGAFQCTDSSPVLQDVLFVGNGTSFMVAGVEIGGASSPIFEDVVFHDNRAGSIAHASAVVTRPESTPTFRNVTFSDNETGNLVPTILVSQTFGRSPYFENCILAFTIDEGGGIRASGPEPTVLAGCCLFGNDYGDIHGNVELVDCVWTDPLFCDHGSGDLHLALNSPCAPENSHHGELIGALGVTCAETSSFVWVTNGTPSGVGEVVVLHASGAFIDSRSAGDDLRGVAVSPRGDLWVASHGSQEVLHLSPEGFVLDALLATSAPTDVLVVPAGHVWVVTPDDNAIGFFWEGGTYYESFSVGEDPRQLAMDMNGSIWVANHGSDDVTKLGAEGDSLATIDVGDGPTAVAVDHDNHIWVALDGWDSVTKLDSDGGFLGSFPVGTDPVALCVDLDNRVWVANHGSGDIVALGSGGGVVETIELPGGAAPIALALDYNERLWVLDEANNVVHAYDMDGTFLGSSFVGFAPTDLAIAKYCPSTSVPEDPDGGWEAGERILSVYPNPARKSALLAYEVPFDRVRVSVEIYDAKGRLVTSLDEGERPAGRRTTRWNCTDRSGRAVGSGVYFCRVRLGDREVIRKLVVVR